MAMMNSIRLAWEGPEQLGGTLFVAGYALYEGMAVAARMSRRCNQCMVITIEPVELT
jgi:hypothetical protein